MGASLNKVFLIGRLGKDPEIRYTPNNTAVGDLRIATDENYTDKSGQKQEKTEWHTVTVWGRTAELCREYLSKGRLVHIEGRLQTDKWEDKNGQPRYTTKIVADRVQFLESRGSGGGGGGGYGGGGRGESSGGGGFGGGGGGGGAGPDEPPPIGDDDIPF